MQDLSTVYNLINFVLIRYASSIHLKTFGSSASALPDLWVCGGFPKGLLIKSKLSYCNLKWALSVVLVMGLGTRVHVLGGKVRLP